MEKAVEVFFRVRRVYEGDLKIVAESGGEPLAAYKREHLAPGEMEHIALPKVLLQRAKGPVTISIQEAAK